jgi:hypothetical protein
MYNVGTNHFCMCDYIGIIGAVAASLTAFFIFLTWYDSFRYRKDKVLVTRFREGAEFFIRVRTKKDNIIEDCEVAFNGKKLIAKEPPHANKKIIYAGGAENFMLWASDLAQMQDKRYVTVFERGHRIFKRRFCDLILDPV